MSVNQAWQGKRFKTKEYLDYEKEVIYQLPSLKVNPDELFGLKLYIKTGMSKYCDIDNIIKPFIDILQKKYGFDDKEIMNLYVEKEIVKRGEEFIEFEII